MIYGFDTDEQHEAAAALLVYAIYRSRNKKQFKVSLDMWDKIERFAKSAAKRARNPAAFIEKFKPKLKCHSLSPQWMEAGIKNDIGIFTRQNREGIDEHIELSGTAKREFLTGVLRNTDHKKLLYTLNNETSWVILLVRERLEREKPQEKFIKKMENENE